MPPVRMQTVLERQALGQNGLSIETLAASSAVASQAITQAGTDGGAPEYRPSSPRRPR